MIPITFSVCARCPTVSNNILTSSASADFIAAVSFSSSTSNETFSSARTMTFSISAPPAISTYFLISSAVTSSLSTGNGIRSADTVSPLLTSFLLASAIRSRLKILS